MTIGRKLFFIKLTHEIFFLTPIEKFILHSTKNVAFMLLLFTFMISFRAMRQVVVAALSSLLIYITRFVLVDNKIDLSLLRSS